MGRLKTQEEYVKELQEINPKVEVIGIYVGANTKIKHKCLIDGHEWDAKPDRLLHGCGCPRCAGNERYTTESFKEKLKEINPNIEILDEYVNNCTKIKCRCLIDDCEFSARPANLLQGRGCPRCAGNERYTTESFKEMLKTINSNIEIVEEYVNHKTKIKCRCLIDGYEWNTNPGSLLLGHGCPRCAGQEHYTTESFKEKLKTINPNIEIIGEYVNTSTKIKCRCLIDGNEWDARSDHLLHGHGCPICSQMSQGDSYMQRFIYYSFKQVYNNVLYRSYALIGMELDVIIPDIKLALEPGSWYWHKDKTEQDLEKRNKAISKGYNIITIYDSFNELEKPYEDCITFDTDLHKDDQRGGKLLENFVKDLFKQLDIEQEVDFDKVREECKILC